MSDRRRDDRPARWRLMTIPVVVAFSVVACASPQPSPESAPATADAVPSSEATADAVPSSEATADTATATEEPMSEADELVLRSWEDIGKVRARVEMDDDMGTRETFVVSHKAGAEGVDVLSVTDGAEIRLSPVDADLPEELMLYESDSGSLLIAPDLSGAEPELVVEPARPLDPILLRPQEAKGDLRAWFFYGRVDPASVRDLYWHSPDGFVAVSGTETFTAEVPGLPDVRVVLLPERMLWAVLGESGAPMRTLEPTGSTALVKDGVVAVLPAKVQEAQLRLRIGYVSEDGTDPDAGIKELVLPLSVQPAAEWTLAGAQLAEGDIEEDDLGTMSIVIEWTDADGNTGTTS